ncbi:hypothetical protein FB446DRAFT_747222 [Lentinula raphanica]|nr:hypothetical protein FB446DRAFT_747222 [Lentinula raphanica]
MSSPELNPAWNEPPDMGDPVRSQRSLKSTIPDKLYDLLFKVVEALPKPFDIPFEVMYQTRPIIRRSLRPWHMLFRLFFPFPWRLPNPNPLPVSFLASISSPHFFYERHDFLPTIRNLLLFRWRDTRTRALYRLYDAICLQDHVESVHEATYIWERLDWQLEDWPDPADPDPERYTVLAGIMEGLVESFNWRLGLGICRDRHKALQKRLERRRDDPEPLEGSPSWPSQVPPSPHPIYLNLNGCSIEEMTTLASPLFKRRNIFGESGSLMFV